jgi:hypothetical protein
MNLPRRRRGRPRGNHCQGATVNCDCPCTGASLAEILDRARPADYNGMTWPLPDWRAAPAWHGASDIGLPEGTQIITGQRERYVMTVNPPRPGGPGPTPQALEVARFLRAKVTILARRGHLDRISPDKLAMLPADRIRNRRTTARLIVDEAAELLRCGGEQR